MKTKILLLRHGQSLGNIEQSFNGHRNTPLSELGKTQAQAVAKFLENAKIDVIYSSDLSRAYDTALATAEKHGLTVITDENLREMFGGDWEGVSFFKVKDIFVQDFSRFIQNDVYSRATNGESIIELGERALKAITNIVEHNLGKTVLIASHGAFIRAFESMISEKGIHGWADIPYVSNASITECEYENGKFTVTNRDINHYLGDMVTKLTTAF